jgi:hypothetical protein
MTDMQAALGVAQMARLDEFIAARRANFRHLKQRLRDCEEFLILPEATPDSDPSWFGFLITLRENAPCDRVDLLRYLDQHKVGTRLLFAGNVTRQPYMKGRSFRISGDLASPMPSPSAASGLASIPGLRPEMLDYAARPIGEFLGSRILMTPLPPIPREDREHILRHTTEIWRAPGRSEFLHHRRPPGSMANGCSRASPRAMICSAPRPGPRS